MHLCIISTDCNICMFAHNTQNKQTTVLYFIHVVPCQMFSHVLLSANLTSHVRHRASSICVSQRLITACDITKLPSEFGRLDPVQPCAGRSHSASSLPHSRRGWGVGHTKKSHRLIGDPSFNQSSQWPDYAITFQMLLSAQARSASYGKQHLAAPNGPAHQSSR